MGRGWWRRCGRGWVGGGGGGEGIVLSFVVLKRTRTNKTRRFDDATSLSHWLSCVVPACADNGAPGDCGLYCWGVFWLDPTWIGESFTTFSGGGYTPGQRALLFLSVGSGGFHLVVAFSAVLVLVALSRGRAPATRTRLLAVYLGIVAAFLVAKAVGLVMGLQVQLPMFDVHTLDGAGVLTRVSGWRIVGTFLAQASLSCIPAFAIVLSGVFISPGAAAAPATPP